MREIDTLTMNGKIFKAKVMPVIETMTQICCADGTKRVVVQYWSLDGQLLAVNDPADGEIKKITDDGLPVYQR